MTHCYIIFQLFLISSFSLIVPSPQPPVDLLQKYHNANQRLSDDLAWSDFLQATRIGDGNHTTNHMYTQTSSSFQSELKNNDGLHIVTKDWWKANDDFKLIHNGSFHNETFVWEIRASWWYVTAKRKGVLGLNNLPLIIDDILPRHYQNLTKDKYIDMLPTETKFPSIDLSPEHPFLAGISRGCAYVKLEYSPTIQLMQKKLESEIRRQSATHHTNALIGLLHLRRGDTTEICDTSLDKVRKYLKCSLGGSEGIHNVTLVMISDDRDDSYRNSIIRLADEFTDLTILDGDNITYGIIDDLTRSGHVSKSMYNVFIAFAVEATLRKSVSEVVDFRLARRRSKCPDCDPAVYQTLDPGSTYTFIGEALQMTPKDK